MYAYMHTCGLQTKLADDGANLWLRSIRLTLGRMNFLFVAQHNNKIIGFAQGMLRIGPEYLGTEKSGHIAHVYIDPTAREKGVGKLLVDQLETSLRQKGASYINLDVVFNNTLAYEFWQRLGYKNDLYQLRKNN